MLSFTNVEIYSVYISWLNQNLLLNDGVLPWTWSAFDFKQQMHHIKWQVRFIN